MFACGKKKKKIPVHSGGIISPCLLNSGDCAYRIIVGDTGETAVAKQIKPHAETPVELNREVEMDHEVSV